MLKFEVLNELTLKVTCDGNGDGNGGEDSFFHKTGAWIGGECYGSSPAWQFDKKMFGVTGNVVKDIIKQIGRRLTGENLPLTESKFFGPSICYYANLAQHVVPIRLAPGQCISVESENLLGFYNCDYDVRFIATGVLGQKGLATSKLTGKAQDSVAVLLCDGNPLCMSNERNGALIQGDFDALVAWTGLSEPSVKLNLSLKNIIGQASGESYVFQFDASKPTTVILQPNERESGIDIGIDGKGGKPTKQNNNLFRQGGNQGLNGAMDALGGLTGGSGGGAGGLGGLAGLGGAIGGILNS